MTQLSGVDISHANLIPSISDVVTRGGLSFVGLKATEGATFVDPTFADRYGRIKANLPHVRVIPYHFLRTDSPATTQAQHFHEVLTAVSYGKPGDCYPTCDAERGLQGQEPIAAEVQAFLDAMWRLGHHCGVYSGDAYWQEHMASLKPAYRWVARYGPHAPVSKWDIWQDAEDRLIAGNKYDHNVFTGDLHAFDVRMGAK